MQQHLKPSLSSIPKAEINVYIHIRLQAIYLFCSPTAFAFSVKTLQKKGRAAGTETEV